MFPKTAIAVSGKRIRLTKERWNHIKERHPEVADKLSEILETIADPDIITTGWEYELVAIRKFNSQDLAVIYKENADDGFAITAFLTRSRKYFEKRGIIWNKQN